MLVGLFLPPRPAAVAAAAGVAGVSAGVPISQVGRKSCFGAHLAPK